LDMGNGKLAVERVLIAIEKRLLIHVGRMSRPKPEP